MQLSYILAVVLLLATSVACTAANGITDRDSSLGAVKLIAVDRCAADPAKTTDVPNSNCVDLETSYRSAAYEPSAGNEGFRCKSCSVSLFMTSLPALNPLSIAARPLRWRGSETGS